MHESLEELKNYREQFDHDAETVDSSDTLESLRIKYLGRKGLIAQSFKKIGGLPPDVRGQFGKDLNAFKAHANERFDTLQNTVAQKSDESWIDVTMPSRKRFTGSIHPLTLVEREVRKVFTRMGFTVMRGPEIEDTWHNFDALNTPDWHPSRDPSDTLYLDNGLLLRTETSPVQIRVMETQKPPIRIIAPGRVFRNDKPDATHSPMFTQVEGLYVDEGVTFSDLKGTVLEFYRQMFGKNVRTRFRPHFFPFTEPSAEVDVSCPFCGGSGCRICKQSGWIEMGGSGMVDPNVFKSVGIDPEKYTGWAFGLGIERLAMLVYGINDIRLFYENDGRFLEQFGGRR